MMEYWIVPGKLPVLIGEVGGESPSVFRAQGRNQFDGARLPTARAMNMATSTAKTARSIEPPVDRGYEAGSDR